MAKNPDFQICGRCYQYTSVDQCLNLKRAYKALRLRFISVGFVLQEAAGMKYKLVAGSENGQSEHSLQRDDHHLALR